MWAVSNEMRPGRVIADFVLYPLIHTLLEWSLVQHIVSCQLPTREKVRWAAWRAFQIADFTLTSKWWHLAQTDVPFPCSSSEHKNKILAGMSPTIVSRCSHSGNLSQLTGFQQSSIMSLQSNRCRVGNWAKAPTGLYRNLMGV